MKRPRVADYPLVALALLLSAFGIAMVYSAGQTDVPTIVAGMWKRQLIWLGVGVLAAYFASRASSRLLDWMATPVFVGTCIVLLLLLFIGTGSGPAARTRSWLAIGGVKLGQPAELAKIAVVLMLAKVFAARKEAPKSLLDLWQPALVVGVPWLFIMAQPDLGTGLVFIGIFFAMLFWSGASWQLLVLVASPALSLVLAFGTPQLWGAWFLLFFALVLWYKPYVAEGVFIVVMNVVMGVVAPVAWEKLDPFQQRRFLAFLDPSADPQRAGYQLLQSQVAIGSGGWLGKGFTEGTQKRLAFLPERHTDFIFPVVGEELGFLGVTIALALFLVLFLRSVRVAARATHPFASLVAFGLVSIWFVHVLVNVGMTMNLMPIAGIPLPFFSYGGSFMLACWIAVGIEGRLSVEGRGKADMLAI
ncbi:MAG TPA: rod shape-determining protein RodA [Gemmatimonadaceae bacterium]|nr:rod shape-determining protein RodA [Gemmatimonadaceae bacterium]